MLLQQSPFRGEDEDEIYDAILADEPLYPIHMPRDSVSILQKLLTREPDQRLGSGPTDAQEIMSQPFFRNINWDDAFHKRIQPPFQPAITSATDTSNFDSEFTSVTPVLTPVQSGKSNSPSCVSTKSLTMLQCFHKLCKKSSADSPTRPTSSEQVSLNICLLAVEEASLQRCLMRRLRCLLRYAHRLSRALTRDVCLIWREERH